MINKKQFGSRIKENFLWPGYNWHLVTTENGLEGAANEYIDGVVEIIIDYLYQHYSRIGNFTSLIDPLLVDSSQEFVAIKSSNHRLKPGSKIRIYGTLQYNGEYSVTSDSFEGDTDYFIIGHSYVPEIFENSAYYTIISDDWYEELEKYPIDPDQSVLKVVSSQSPLFLPTMSLSSGYVYNHGLDIAGNRKLLQRAISFYKIKGSIPSIYYVMKNLGYSCEVVEPYKFILKYGISQYDSKCHFQDWAYYHDGVFEIVTDGISLSDYQYAIKSTVQPAGTRLVGRSNIILGLIPSIGEILNYYSDSYFSEALVKAYKAGNIYDTITDPRSRTRSGNVELWGVYLDLSNDLDKVISYRRIWDSKVLSFDDLVTPIKQTTPANTYSTVRGAYSGAVELTTGYKSQYDETTPLNVQLDLSIVPKNERPAMYSEYCNKRSGSLARSGLDGQLWNFKHCLIIDLNKPVSMNIPEFCDNTIEVSVNLDGGFLTYSSFYGNILSVNDQYSGIREIFGIELGQEFRSLPEVVNWAEKLYWSWDDVAVPIDATSTNAVVFGTLRDIVNDPPVVSYYSQKETYDEDHSLSGVTSCYDIEVTLGN